MNTDLKAAILSQYSSHLLMSTPLKTFVRLSAYSSGNNIYKKQNQLSDHLGSG